MSYWKTRKREQKLLRAREQ